MKAAEIEGGGQQQQQQQRRRQRGAGKSVPEYPVSQAASKKRSYGLKRWNKRRSTDNKFVESQPPAGWVLVWEGRFKRWKRRWFLAHPAGLLLYYKSSTQLGRPGCISLQGAHVSPVVGKERQIKIRRGSSIYYLRTLNRENRLAWLDTINKSIHTYEKSLQKVSSGKKPGIRLVSQQSVPLHLAEEWRQQEHELDRRLAERMKELQPTQQAFLQQLQSVQQSLSVIGGALGFTSKYMPVVCTSYAETAQQPAVSERLLRSHSTTLNLKENVNLERDSSGDHSSSFSGPIPDLSVERNRTFEEDQKLDDLHPSASTEDNLSQYKHGSCISKDMFRLKRRETNGSLPPEKGHSSDTDVCSSTAAWRSFASNTDTIGKSEQKLGGLTVSHSVDNFSLDDFNGSLEKDGIKNDSDAQSSCKRESHKSYMQRGNSQSQSPTRKASNISNYPSQGQLHRAWERMQDAFSEILREEIRRVIELEAEISTLQESVALMPQLQQDLLDLKEKMQRESMSKTVICDGDMDGAYGDDEGTDDDICAVVSDVATEDYFEALEVLNQHEFIAKSTSPEDLEIFAERVENSQEPPEETDLMEPENLSEVEGEDYDNPRTRLPAPRPLQRGFSLWSVLRNAIGKDLNHITMPATINEPLSVLQKCAEELQYSNLIEKASQLSDSIERLVWVSIFYCATYHGSPLRDAKPFNPLLGETYEWQDGRSRFIAEQVSHHPPILAFHCDNMNNFTIYGEIEVKNRFWGKSVEVFPVGNMHLRMSRFGDHFTWNKMTTCIHNVVVGKLWIDNYGECVIKNHATGDESHIRFHKANSKEKGRLSVKIFDSNGILKCSLNGNYMKEIFVTPEESWSRKHAYKDSECLWKCPSPPEDYKQQYCFSRFTIGLNELTPQLRRALPPTDSRFRPDQRALEDGNLELATPEKMRLEEKQREASKKRKEKGEDWRCMWFQQRVSGVLQVRMGGAEEPSWIFNGQYWDARERQDWNGCPDIM